MKTCEFCKYETDTTWNLFLHLKDVCHKVPRQMRRRLNRRFEKQNDRARNCIKCGRTVIKLGNPYCENHQHLIRTATDKVMKQLQK